MFLLKKKVHYKIHMFEWHPRTSHTNSLIKTCKSLSAPHIFQYTARWMLHKFMELATFFYYKTKQPTSFYKSSNLTDNPRCSLKPNHMWKREKCEKAQTPFKNSSGGHPTGTCSCSRIEHMYERRCRIVIIGESVQEFNFLNDFYPLNGVWYLASWI